MQIILHLPLDFYGIYAIIILRSRSDPEDATPL